MWSGTTGAFIGTLVLQGSHNAIEDLSVDFAARSDTCGGPNQPPCEGGGQLPEPSSISLAGIALGLLGLVARGRRRKQA